MERKKEKERQRDLVSPRTRSEQHSRDPSS